MDTKRTVLLIAIVTLSMFAVLAMPAAAQVEVKINTTITAAPGGTVNDYIWILGPVTNLGAGNINLTYNPSVVHVTSVTAGTAGGIITPNIDNVTGVARIGFLNPDGVSGNVSYCTITFQSVGAPTEVSPLNLTVITFADVPLYNPIPNFVTNGSFMVQDVTPPVVTNPTAIPAPILNDNGRCRIADPPTNVSQLNVTVTDNIGVTAVTINLSALGGSATQAMTNIPGTDIWTVTTKANELVAPGCVNKTNNLVVNASDATGNYNNTVSIALEVRRRGDVIRNNAADMVDALRIARGAVGLDSVPDAFLADVQPCGGNGAVDMVDALYIARFAVGLEPVGP